MATKKILLPACLLLALLAGGYAVYLKMRQGALLENGETFARTIAGNIIQDWNIDYFRQVASGQLLASFDAGGIEAAFRNFRRVGTLQSLGGVRGELLNAGWLPAAQPLMARYYISGEFSSGPAEIYVELVQSGETWQVSSFYIQTPLLAE